MIFRDVCEKDADFIASAIDLGFTDGWNKEMVNSAFKGGRFIGFIAEESDIPVGFVTASIGYDDADIESVFVLPTKRNLGVAKTLLSKIEEVIKNLKKQRILLEVKEGNAPAINLYSALGYKEISIRKKYYKDGKNAIVMQKEI